MQKDRLRVPVDEQYLVALGRAAYCFCALEWNAVYCGEKLSPGYVNLVAAKPAGQIAGDINRFVAMVPDAAVRERFAAASSEFARLVKRRNDLMHANPATVLGNQRLVRRGEEWTLEQLEEIADQFAACSIDLNELLHGLLGAAVLLPNAESN